MPYSPTIISGATPAVTIQSTGGISYNELMQALGSYSFGVKAIRVRALSLEQLFQIWQYNHYSSTGNKIALSIVPNVDPYQEMTAIEINTKDHNVVLDGRSNFTLDILPNESMVITFDADEVSLGQLLDAVSKSNIKKVFDEAE